MSVAGDQVALGGGVDGGIIRCARPVRPHDIDLTEYEFPEKLSGPTVRSTFASTVLGMSYEFPATMMPMETIRKAGAAAQVTARKRAEPDR